MIHVGLLDTLELNMEAKDFSETAVYEGSQVSAGFLFVTGVG
jgi:hypothetical protein